MLHPSPGYTTQAAVDAASALIAPNALPYLLIKDLSILCYGEEDREEHYAEEGRALYEAAKKAGDIKETLDDYVHKAYELACRPVYAAIAAQLRAAVGGLPENLTFVRNEGGGSGSKFWHIAAAAQSVYIGNLDDNEIDGYTDFVARALQEAQLLPEQVHALVGNLQVVACIQDLNAENPQKGRRYVAWQRYKGVGAKKLKDVLTHEALQTKVEDRPIKTFFEDKMKIPSASQHTLADRYYDSELIYINKNDFYFIDFGAFNKARKIAGFQRRHVKHPK